MVRIFHKFVNFLVLRHWIIRNGCLLTGNSNLWKYLCTRFNNNLCVISKNYSSVFIFQWKTIFQRHGEYRSFPNRAADLWPWWGGLGEVLKPCYYIFVRDKDVMVIHSCLKSRDWKTVSFFLSQRKQRQTTNHIGDTRHQRQNNRIRRLHKVS